MINIDHVTPAERLNPSIRLSCNDLRSRIAADAHGAIKSSWMAQGESGWDNSISSHSSVVTFGKLQYGLLFSVLAMMLVMIAVSLCK